MKKIIFTVLFSLAAIASFAQSEKDARFGNRLAIEVGGRTFLTGGICQYMVGPTLGLDFYCDRVFGPIDFGFGANGSFMYGMTGDDRYQCVEVQVPLRLRWGFYTGGKTRFLLFAGPTPVVGVHLSRQSELGDFYDEYAEDIFKRFDIMLGGGVGAIFGNHFRVTLSYDYGYISRRTTILSATNIQAGLGLAWVF